MARSTRKMQRESEILRRAREMAASGEYHGWLIIEQLLRFDHGYPEARQVLDRHYIRKELDELCQRARARSQKPDEDDPPSL